MTCLSDRVAGAVVFVVATLGVLVAAHGQSVGANVAGIVHDTSGARLQNATVTITNTLNGRTAVVTTGLEGEFRVVALLPADYALTAEHPGFEALTQRVTLLVGSDATVNFTLGVSGITQRTTVAGVVPLVEVARSQPSSAVTRRDIEVLPVLERNFLVLAQLLPGSAPINTTIGRFAVTKFGGVADQRSGYTTLVDGGAVDDAQWGSPTINVGQDAIQEFKVFRNQFDAQYGHALNAVVSVVTRSGTNRYSGSGFYFGRDRALNARNVFATTKPPFDEQRVGGSFGGPVVRDRSHFFGAYERDNVDTVRIIALPPSNPFASRENGVFPATTHNQTASARLDHRVSATHALSLRYAFDNQESLRAGLNVSSDSSQIDTVNRSHSVVFEETWSKGRSAVNALRVHLLNHTLGTVPRNADIGIVRPSGTTGQTNADSQTVPRTVVNVSDAWYVNTARHDVRFGGEMTFGTHDLDAHVFEHGVFDFQTDALFDASNANTWPIAFRQQKPTVVNYRSKEFGLFAQDDWRLASGLRVNAGIRYDIDLNLRLNGFYRALLNDPAFAGLEHFVSGDRGTDSNNVQPRLGATWDVLSDGHVIVRGGWGLYVTRNRPWYQLRSLNQFASSVVRIAERDRLRHFPDISAVLAGRTLDDFVASGGPRQIGTLIPDDFVQPYASNTSAGVGWQLHPTTALDVDYIHSYANHQTGFTDRNLPVSGALSATNPRPVPQFGQVLTIENYSRSWYDALETQFRTRIGARHSIHASYTLSRSYMDGVDFFLTTRGTLRSPNERGYNPTDQRHNLAVAGTVMLPWQVQLSGILKLISGSPLKVQAGLDLDGDTIVVNDRPPSVPITVGREQVDESLAAINEFRAARRLPSVDGSLLRLDPYRAVDLRLAKNVRAGGARRLEVLIEAFNVTNHVNFRPPSGNPAGGGASMNSPSFLVRTAARDARQIQWGIRYAF